MFNLLRHKRKDTQAVVETVSEIIAELFDVDPIIPQVTFATPDEIEEMQTERRDIVARRESYLIDDGNVIVIGKPESTGRTLDPESFLCKTLAYELSDIYQKAIGRYSAPFLFPLSLMDRTRLRVSDGVRTWFYQRL